jgi:hypothetical protein
MNWSSHEVPAAAHIAPLAHPKPARFFGVPQPQPFTASWGLILRAITLLLVGWFRSGGHPGTLVDAVIRYFTVPCPLPHNNPLPLSPSCPPPPPCGRLPQPKVPAPPPLPPALTPRFEGFPSLRSPGGPCTSACIDPTCTFDPPPFHFVLVRLFLFLHRPQSTLSVMSNCTPHQALSNLPLLHISLICSRSASSFLLQDKVCSKCAYFYGSPSRYFNRYRSLSFVLDHSPSY